MPLISRAGGRPGTGAWPWLSLIPMGLGAWVPIWAGLRVSRWSWVAWGTLWTVFTIFGWALPIAASNDGGGGAFIIAGWVGGTVTSFAIRGRYAEAIGVDDPLDRADPLDLDSALVDGLRSRVIFLPRPGAA